jgi:hypothetical protein
VPRSHRTRPEGERAIALSAVEVKAALRMAFGPIGGVRSDHVHAARFDACASETGFADSIRDCDGV